MAFIRRERISQTGVPKSFSTAPGVAVEVDSPDVPGGEADEKVDVEPAIVWGIKAQMPTATVDRVPYLLTLFPAFA